MNCFINKVIEVNGIINSKDMCIEADGKNYYIEELFKDNDGLDIKVLIVHQEDL